MDPRAKRAALRTIPYGLYAVGVRAKEGTGPANLGLFIASWVTQCSFQPPLLAVGVRRGSRANDLIRESGVFVLNVLGPHQREAAARILKGGPLTADTAYGMPYRAGITGAPVLEGCRAFVECRVLAIHETGGDHDVVVAEVIAAGAAAEPGPALRPEEMGWQYAG